MYGRMSDTSPGDRTVPQQAWTNERLSTSASSLDRPSSGMGGVSRIERARMRLEQKRREHEREIARATAVRYASMRQQDYRDQQYMRRMQQVEQAAERRSQIIDAKRHFLRDQNRQKLTSQQKAEEEENARLMSLLQREQNEAMRLQQWAASTNEAEKVKRMEALQHDMHRQEVIARSKAQEETMRMYTADRLEKLPEKRARRDAMINDRQGRLRIANLEKARRHDEARQQQEERRMSLAATVHQRQKEREEVDRQIEWCMEQIRRDRTRMVQDIEQMKTKYPTR